MQDYSGECAETPRPAAAEQAASLAETDGHLGKRKVHHDWYVLYRRRFAEVRDGLQPSSCSHAPTPVHERSDTSTL